MLKVFGFVKRNARLTHDEYRAGHVGHHNSFGRRLRHIRGYVLNVRSNRTSDDVLGPLAAIVTRGEPADFDERWDGWGQLLFDSLEDYLAARQGEPDRAAEGGLARDPRVATTGGDGPYLYSGAPFQFHVDEHVAVPVRRPESRLCKLAQFAKRPAHLAPEQFRAYWTGRHAALVSQLPGLRGYIVNFRTPLDVMSGFFEPDSPAFTPEGAAEREAFYGQWDGIAELWFDRSEQFVAGRSSPELGARLDALEKELFDAVWYREVDETVVVVPNRAPAPPFYYR